MTEQSRTRRFAMRITRWSQVFMIPFGVLSRRAYVQVQPGKLHVRFGPMFDEHIVISNIASAAEAQWPRWAGVGPRMNFRGSVALVSSYDNVVKLTFKEPIDVHVYLVPVKCRTLYFSLEDPEGFLEQLGFAPAGKRAKAA